MDALSQVPSRRISPTVFAEMRAAMKGVRVDGSLIDRFVAKCVRDERSGCILWLAALDRSGYGQFGARRRVVEAHRFAYEHFVGPIPDGLVIDHRCRNRSCVNPHHLAAVTPGENTLAPGSLSPSRINADKTHCVNGHRFDERNTYRHHGRRQCRACNAAAVARYSAKRGAA